jgi:hypothetical protein
VWDKSIAEQFGSVEVEVEVDIVIMPWDWVVSVGVEMAYLIQTILEVMRVQHLQAVVAVDQVGEGLVRAEPLAEVEL